MQYLATKEEMKQFAENAKRAAAAPDPIKMQEFCTMVADELILKEGWKEGKAWGCILTVDHEWYCDDCPARGVCPHSNKRWSK